MAKKSTGRPVGAQTQDRPVADEVIPVCPHCGSRDRGEFRSLRRVEGCGEINGRKYDGVELRNCNCNSCGGAMVVRRHLWIA